MFRHASVVMEGVGEGKNVFVGVSSISSIIFSVEVMVLVGVEGAFVEGMGEICLVLVSTSVIIGDTP